MQSTQSTQPPQPAQPTIELMYFADCPTYRGAQATLLEALHMAGLMAVPVHMVCVQSDEDARRLAFYGSPTIRINGQDVVPFALGALPCLCCRFYRTADGGWQSQPTLESLLTALAPYTTLDAPDTHDA